MNLLRSSDALRQQISDLANGVPPGVATRVLHERFQRLLRRLLSHETGPVEYAQACVLVRRLKVVLRLLPPVTATIRRHMPQ